MPIVIYLFNIQVVVNGGVVSRDKNNNNYTTQHYSTQHNSTQLKTKLINLETFVIANELQHKKTKKKKIEKTIAEEKKSERERERAGNKENKILLLMHMQTLMYGL